jgi:hypothetical protein
VHLKLLAGEKLMKMMRRKTSKKKIILKNKLEFGP